MGLFGCSLGFIHKGFKRFSYDFARVLSGGLEWLQRAFCMCVQYQRGFESCHELMRGPLSGVYQCLLVGFVVK